MGLFPPGQRTQHQPQSSSRGRSLGLVPEQPPLSELHLGPEGGQGTRWKHRRQGFCWVEASFHCLQVTVVQSVQQGATGLRVSALMPSANRAWRCLEVPK